ncbi:family 16 glycoside hydrolase [Botrimarina hoheduenensis]|uniref:Trehalose utilization n=1 Tax=Botrimarina hoheduenensis TaxID=2528000 RepID=A0A5C5WAB0_9BACT|nr:family 16 glycoside hydrolase [Botrimarina hoheduenensis]TWT47243.1 Trehalose utilization [Botrimarina hoheduenensis]
MTHPSVYASRWILLVIALAVPAVVRAQPATGDWVVLMDGSSLDAWRGYQRTDLPAAWKINEAGELAFTPGESGGDLVTKQEFGDFELEFEWRVAPGSNSGVLYGASEDKPHVYETGMEYQVLDDAGFGDAEPRHQAGALYGLYPRKIDATKPADQWNTARIVVEGTRIEHWLNGELVVEAERGSTTWKERIAASKFAAWDRFAANERGRIALQDHGGAVWYRNVRIRERSHHAAAQPGDRPARMLFVTQSAGFRHSTVTRKPSELSSAEQIMQRLGIESGAFRVDCTQDVETDFTPELLANYDVVAFYSTGKLPIPAETLTWFLQDWLAEQGHAVLGIHPATDTYKDYEPYWDMIGGTFDGHPWTADTDVVIKVHDGDHPASRPWGASGTRIAFKDEIYLHKHWQPEKVRVLMSLDMERTALKQSRHVPILWVKEYGAGRVMYLSLGHREDMWERPQFQASLIGGVEWLLNKQPGDATPNPELSAAEQRLAEQAAEVTAVAD